MKNTFTSLLFVTLLVIFGKTGAQTINTAAATSITGATSTATVDTSVFGNGFWNVYCFNGNLVSTPAKTVYYGSYTENNLNFDSRTRYPYSNLSTAVPSNANSLSGKAYSGIASIGTVHTVIYKRIGFTPGYYQIDIPVLDDMGYLLINGTQVWNYKTCCEIHSNVWTGMLNSNSTIELKYVNLASGSAAAMNIQAPISLPVTFSDFKVSKESAGVQLEWATASEKNNNYFTVEKSTDGISFEAIATVKGAGNSNGILHYSAMDNQAAAGISYYRIKQTNFDNYSSYTTVKSISNSSVNGFSVSPNPGNAGEAMYIYLTADKTQSTQIIVRDLQGQEYFSKTVSDTETNQGIAINAEAALAPGMYIVLVSSGNNNYSQKIIVR